MASEILFKHGFYLYLIDLEKFIVHNILIQESFFVLATFNHESMKFFASKNFFWITPSHAF